jgi:hypothetical protein
MRKTPFDIKRKEIQRRIKRNEKANKNNLFELIRRASQPRSG